MTVTVTVFEMRHDREERYGPCHGSYMTPSWGFLPRTASPCWKPAGQHSKAGQQDPQHPAPPCICSQPATGSEGERPSPEGLVSQEEKGEGEGGALRRGLEKGGEELGGRGGKGVRQKKGEEKEGEEEIGKEKGEGLRRGRSEWTKTTPRDLSKVPGAGLRPWSWLVRP